MENQELLDQSTRPSNCWTSEEQDELIRALGFICNEQKAFGKDVDIKVTYEYWKHKLDGRFSMQQVLYALDKFTDTKTDLPQPADIIQTLDPPKPRITEAQFVQACKAQERNGYPIMSYEKDIIEEYHRQQNDALEGHREESDKILEMGGGLKRIEFDDE